MSLFQPLTLAHGPTWKNRFMLAPRTVGRIIREERPCLIEIGSPFLVPWIVQHATRELDVPLVSFYHTNLTQLLAPRGGSAGWVPRALIDVSSRYLRRLDQLFAMTIVASEYSAAELARGHLEPPRAGEHARHLPRATGRHRAELGGHSRRHHPNRTLNPMAKSTIYAGLEIGTSKICVVVGEASKRVHDLASVKSLPNGVKEVAAGDRRVEHIERHIRQADLIAPAGRRGVTGGAGDGPVVGQLAARIGAALRGTARHRLSTQGAGCRLR